MAANNEPDVSRKTTLKGISRAVIKVGSGVLTKDDGLNTRVINSLARDITSLKKTGIEIILVSSGAIASGLKKLGISKRPNSISHQQALAAIGQSSLMMTYEKAFGRHGNKVAQILITRGDFNNRQRYLNARNTIFTLLNWDIIPIINENDTVVVDELKFGDNDTLSAMVTNLIGGQLLVNLTDIDGLFDKDPRLNHDARLMKTIDRINRGILRYAGNIPGFLGTGGMTSKVKAAQRMAVAGIPTIIANGLRPGILKDIFSGKTEGTLFIPQDSVLCSRKHWIAFTKSPRGRIGVDSGATKAILTGGKSLLPSGINEVTGRFNIGDSVAVLDHQGRALAVGLVNYKSGDINKIMGRKSHEIESILGFKNEDEIIHRDNLVVTDVIQDDDACRPEPPPKK